MQTVSNLVFNAVQIFNRRSIGYLWDRKAELDPGQVSIINSIYNNKKKGSVVAEQTITYKLSSKTAGKLGYGRLYGTKGSFETLEKECRGTICKDYYHDIDIVNCHPVLLLQFARSKYNIDLPEVDKYCDNRDQYLKTVMTENDCSRDDAKAAIISILYGGTCNQKSFLWELSEEVRGFSKKLFQRDEYADLAKACKSEKNMYGSFLAFILQTEERHCMLAMKDHLEQQGWSVDVLCYDGVMIRKREGVIYDLIATQQAIELATGYKIALVAKEFSSFEMPSIAEEVVKGVSLEAYKEMKREFELNHFYHIPSDQFVEVCDDSNLHFMSLSHAHEYLNSSWCFKLSDKIGDSTPFLDIWRKDRTRKMCISLSFKDSGNPQIFTLPIRWAFLKAESSTNPRTIGLFLELIDLITNNKSNLKDYVLKWLAHLLQKPCDLPGVGLVLTGAKGIGKDTLGDFLQKYVVGDALSMNYTTNKQFFGTHDTGKLNKFLIKLEETSKKECLENASELKSIVTASSITVNPKGVKEITSDNFARYIFTTNKPNPIDLSDGERRFVLLNCSRDKKGDFDFWSEVREVLFCPSGGRTVAEYLLSLNISSFNPRKLPENDYQSSILISEETSEERFIKVWDGETMKASSLYDKYVRWCQTSNLPYATNAAWFGKNIQGMVRDGIIKQKTINGTTNYSKE
jgi:hypothetical protein